MCHPGSQGETWAARQGEARRGKARQGEARRPGNLGKDVYEAPKVTHV